MAIHKPGLHSLEPENAPQYLLEHLNQRRSIPLTQSLVLGRSEGDEKFTHDSLMSARHVRVHLEDSKVFIIDLGSTNGTRVNGHKLEVRQKVLFTHGDILKVGRQKFRLQDIEKMEMRRQRFFPHFRLSHLFELLVFTACLLGISYLAYENRDFKAELQSFTGEAASADVIAISDSLRATSTNNLCAQYNVNEKLKCLGVMIQLLSQKGIPLIAIKELYILNSLYLHNELMTPDLSSYRQLDLRADSLQNILLLLELVLKKSATSKSLKLSAIIENLAIASNISLIYPYVDQAFIQLSQDQGVRQTTIVNHYSLLKPKLLEAGSQTALEGAAAHWLGLVANELDKKIGD